MTQKKLSKNNTQVSTAVHSTEHQKMQKHLASWYQKVARPLPWRKDLNPYRIWISEVMLQQTTSAAVIPFFNRFMQTFPNVHDLANADLSQVYEAWAGLGYYSRARNLHQAAQRFAQQGFPKTHSELLEFPGIGPYTSRAIASIAFAEPVGVLDGNVIRVLSRLHAVNSQWWLPKHKLELQEQADHMAQHPDPGMLNQAMMELGATICTPQKPLCLLCPLKQHCLAFARQKTDQYPLARPRKATEIWVWDVDLYMRATKVLLQMNDYAPFLKKQWIFPGKIIRQSTAPQDFSYTHTITHHKIFVRVHRYKTQPKLNKATNTQWINQTELKKINPSSLLQKLLRHLEHSGLTT